jgi:hypothetical protein
MKVFEVIPDSNHYQSLLPEDRQIWSRKELDFDGTPRAAVWKPPPVFCLYPKLKKGDFLSLGAGRIVTTPQATEKVRTFFEMAGEILPLPYEGEEYSVLNITECINCLDADRSEWLVTATGVRALLKTPVFYPDRFTESSIFLIPEKCRGFWFTWNILATPKRSSKLV